MKKSLKVILIVLGVMVGVFALDTLQARIFDYIDRGLLVNHYKYTNGNEMTIFVWENTTY